MCVCVCAADLYLDHQAYVKRIEASEFNQVAKWPHEQKWCEVLW